MQPHVVEQRRGTTVSSAWPVPMPRRAPTLWLVLQTYRAVDRSCRMARIRVARVPRDVHSRPNWETVGWCPDHGPAFSKQIEVLSHWYVGSRVCSRCNVLARRYTPAGPVMRRIPLRATKESK